MTSQEECDISNVIIREKLKMETLFQDIFRFTLNFYETKLSDIEKTSYLQP